ncbi:MAG: 2-hydroxyacyl-CoA dehydratase [Thermoplasmata archaeon]|nr:MAG: 2-hydroxyacyl-CoA dehydratase [Thermoplasmata archaeon]
MNTVGITALVPPELIFACGKKPCDINNFVPNSVIQPTRKLCAWTAIWREMLLRKELSLDYLVVVAGGDCHNALVDGQKVAMSGLKTFYFFYPFEEEKDYLKEQLEGLSTFMGGIADSEMFEKVKYLKRRALELEKKRIEGKIPSDKAFKILVSTSDLKGDLDHFEKTLMNLQEENVDYESRVALLGVPPIYQDFHEVMASLGLHVVYDELPYEFARLSGRDIDELAGNYCEYTFARKLDFRMDFIEKELAKRKIDGIIHYTQYSCHHLLEDDMLRNRLDYPFLTIQGDLPGRTSEQAKIRLEAFSEMLTKM